MKEDGQSNEPRKLSRREKIWTAFYASVLSFGAANFLLGHAEGIRSQDTVRISYDTATRAVEPFDSDGDLVVKVVEFAGERVPSRVIFEIEKERGARSFIYALFGGVLLFQGVWRWRHRYPGPKREKWDPDLRG